MILDELAQPLKRRPRLFSFFSPFSCGAMPVMFLLEGGGRAGAWVYSVGQAGRLGTHVVATEMSIHLCRSGLQTQLPFISFYKGCPGRDPFPDHPFCAASE